MTILLARHGALAEHDTGRRHPESAERLRAVLSGAGGAAVAEDLVAFEPAPAGRDTLERVHTPRYVGALEQLCRSGGGRLDPDTVAAPGSFQAALISAGAGLEAARRLRAGQAGAAFLALRPPGHHALAGRAMGFCLFNNVAVTARALADGGERVLVVDWDAHHGNGTQEIFWEDPQVAYVSLHQYPFYPGTGAATEMGEGPGLGATVNVPMPAGASGEAYRRAFEEVIVPFAERFSPHWVLISAGFDAHRADPLTNMSLTSGDFADLTRRTVALAPPARCIAFLEGGYDLTALELSVRACIDALGGVFTRPEPMSSPQVADELAGTIVSEVRTLHLAEA